MCRKELRAVTPFGLGGLPNPYRLLVDNMIAVSAISGPVGSGMLGRTMNSIVKKVLLVLAIVFGLYTALLYSFARLAITPSFTSLQDAAAGDELQRCRLILKKEVAITKGLCSDWATWDDSYAFIADRNPEFIKSNLELAALKSSKTNTVIFIDNTGQIVWGKTYDLNTGDELYVPQFSPDSIRAATQLYSGASPDKATSGLLLVNGVPTAVAACPMVTSKREGPVRGTLLMGRFLSAKDIKDLASSLGTDFSIVPADKAEFSPEAGQDISIRPHGTNRMQICSRMEDIFGKPTMVIVADIPTPIASKGQMVGWFVSISVVVAGAITLVVTFLLLKAIVMRRIEHLGHTIEQIANSDNDAPGDDSDELARHEEMVMSIVDRLDNTEHALDASHQRFWSAFFNAPFPIVIHNDEDKVLHVNRCWTVMTGYTLADVPTVNDLCGKASPGESRQLRNALTVAQTGSGEPDESETCAIKTKDDTTLHWFIRSFSLGGENDHSHQTISMAIDMTQAVESRRTRRDSESLFESLSQAIPAVAYVAEFTSDAFLTYISPRVADLLGRQVADIRNSADPWGAIVSHEDYRRVMEARWAALSAKKPFVCDYRAKCADGRTVPVHEEANLTTTAKGPMIQGVIFDVSGGLSFSPSLAAASAS